jgi:hypothetical protein
MDEPVELDLVARLEDAAHALRQGDADVRWMVEALAARLESILPDRVRVERRGILHRRVVAVTLTTATQRFVCRVPSAGALVTGIAEVRSGIEGRLRPLPPAQWAKAMETALNADLARSDAEREALERLVP